MKNFSEIHAQIIAMYPAFKEATSRHEKSVIDNKALYAADYDAAKKKSAEEGSMGFVVELRLTPYDGETADRETNNKFRILQREFGAGIRDEFITPLQNKLNDAQKRMPSGVCE